MKMIEFILFGMEFKLKKIRELVMILLNYPKIKYILKKKQMNLSSLIFLSSLSYSSSHLSVFHYQLDRLLATTVDLHRLLVATTTDFNC